MIIGYSTYSVYAAKIKAVIQLTKCELSFSTDDSNQCLVEQRTSSQGTKYKCVCVVDLNKVNADKQCAFQKTLKKM